MTEHPLTDEICEKLADTEDRPFTDIEMDNMRAAADWQLEQVIEWVSKFGLYLFKHPWHKDEVIRELKKAMRPTTITTTHEDNND